MPPDCIERVISQRGENDYVPAIFNTTSLPHVLFSKSTWHEQQQQQRDDLRSCGKLQRDRRDGDHNNVEGVAGNCSEHNVVKEDDSFHVDLRVHGVSQDVIYTRIANIQTFVDRLQDGYRTKSTMNDLKQDGKSIVFSEPSRRKIKEEGQQ